MKKSTFIVRVVEIDHYTIFIKIFFIIHNKIMFHIFLYYRLFLFFKKYGATFGEENGAVFWLWSFYFYIWIGLEMVISSLFGLELGKHILPIELILLFGFIVLIVLYLYFITFLKIKQVKRLFETIDKKRKMVYNLIILFLVIFCVLWPFYII